MAYHLVDVLRQKSVNFFGLDVFGVELLLHRDDAFLETENCLLHLALFVLQALKHTVLPVNPIIQVL
jgi:lactate dehydrogenase-like 2-hydroxyacid dehydrogenase